MTSLLAYTPDRGAPRRARPTAVSIDPRSVIVGGADAPQDPLNASTRSAASAVRQREEHLAKANLVRRRRRLLRQRIAALEPPAGAALVARVLLAPPEFAQRMSVGRLLTATTGVGAVRAKAIAGAATTRPLGSFSNQERASIASACTRRVASLEGLGRRRPQQHERSQAMRALASADRIRLARAGALRMITQTPGTGLAAWRAASLINATARPVELDGLTVKAVLEAIPGVGERAAGALLGELALTESTQLLMLSRSRATRAAGVLIARHGRRAGPCARRP
jgi:hypothetical protein